MITESFLKAKTKGQLSGARSKKSACKSKPNLRPSFVASRRDFEHVEAEARWNGILGAQPVGNTKRRSRGDREDEG